MKKAEYGYRYAGTSLADAVMDGEKKRIGLPLYDNLVQLAFLRNKKKKITYKSAAQNRYEATMPAIMKSFTMNYHNYNRKVDCFCIHLSAH